MEKKEEIVWTVTEPNGTVTTSKPREKVPHYIEVKITKTMDDNTKAWYEKFNIMRNRLFEIGEMESK